MTLSSSHTTPYPFLYYRPMNVIAISVTEAISQGIIPAIVPVSEYLIWNKDKSRVVQYGTEEGCKSLVEEINYRYTDEEVEEMRHNREALMYGG